MDIDLEHVGHAWLLDPFTSKLAWVLGGLLLIVIATRLLRTTIMEMGEWLHGDQYHGRIARVADANWIELTLRDMVDYKPRRTTRDRLFTRLLDEMEGLNGQVEIAASTLNIEKLPPLNVNLRRSSERRP